MGRESRSRSPERRGRDPEKRKKGKEEREVQESGKKSKRSGSREERMSSLSPMSQLRRRIQEDKGNEERASKKSKREKKKSKRSKRKKSKKKKSSSRRDSSSSSSSSDSDDGDSDSSTELLLRLERERQELKERRRRDKEFQKATETLEEKRNRRILKKEVKALREKEKMGWDEEYAHFTNEDNPFGDSNLMQNFRWGKKLEKEGLDKLDERDLQRIQRQKLEEQRAELEKVKTRRLIREKEREERQELIEMEERSRENEKFSKWREEEDEFHLQQARLRSKIRIQDGRAKPIDLLAKYISAEDEVDAIEMHEPYTYLNGLTIRDLEDLLADIKVYEEIDLDKNRDFWDDIVIIVQDELGKLRKMDDAKSQYELAAERRQGINKAVAADVQKVFEGKTAEQLAMLQQNIEQKLRHRADGIDISYWESLLSQLKAHLARARLRDKHKDNLKNKLELLKAEQVIAAAAAATTSTVKQESPKAGGSKDVAVAEQGEEEAEEAEVPVEDTVPYLTVKKKKAKKPEDPAVCDYLSGNYSPRYLQPEDLELATIVATEAEDEVRREMDQSRILTGGKKVDNVMNAEEMALEREAKKGMGDDEASFAVESALEQTYEWSDKYRPRKPRYFNRVHTGFEWNKYNQTHYDVDNPPPKVVQGYKFNIFYPDLIDKKATPQYTLTPCEDNRDFCVLRIHAGPPYEDIAFKIVSREWEYGYKRGFKCQFHNNIFQLWFHFKRLRYRR